MPVPDRLNVKIGRSGSLVAIETTAVRVPLALGLNVMVKTKPLAEVGWVRTKSAASGPASWTKGVPVKLRAKPASALARPNEAAVEAEPTLTEPKAVWAAALAAWPGASSVA